MNQKNNEFGFGCIPSKYDVRDYVLKSGVDINEIPDSYQLKPVRIKHQGTSQTCTAHVMSELVEYHDCVDTGKYHKFSTEFIYGFRNIFSEDDYVGDGMYLRDGLKVIQKYGDVPYVSLPGNHEYRVAMNAVKRKVNVLLEYAYPNRISSYYKLKTSDEVKYSIFNDGPVAAGIRWFDGMTCDDEGNLTYKKSNDFTGHAVLILGYNPSGYTVQNSWGSSWGLNGLFKITNNDFKNLVFEAYGVTDDIIKLKMKNKNLDVFNKLFNKLVNLFVK